MYSIIFKMLRKNFRNGRMYMMQSGRNCVMRCRMPKMGACFV